MPSWLSGALEQPLFTDVIELSKLNTLNDFPSIEWLNTHFASGRQRFVAQGDSYPFKDLYYEQVINEHSQIPTRLNNYHDLFNAFIWSVFPATKRLLNQLHCQDIVTHGQKIRGKRRNAITLFDECGLVIAYSHEQQKNQLREHQWQQVFWQQREEWGASISAMMFGHANYEMALQPFLGLTGKAYFIKVANDFWKLTTRAKYQCLDQQLVKEFGEQNCLADNTKLSPLPFLGVPGWYDENQSVSFYDNQNYFRPKRKE